MFVTLFIDWLLAPQAPAATIFVLLLSVLLTLLTSLANRLLTNPQQLKAWRKEIKDWTDALKEAQRGKDKKKLAKVEKQRDGIMKLQGKMSWQSMKVSLLFFIPFLIMWQVLIGIYTDSVAFLPGFGPLPLVLWYFICSMFFSTLFSRAFGVGMGAME